MAIEDKKSTFDFSFDKFNSTQGTKDFGKLFIRAHHGLIVSTKGKRKRAFQKVKNTLDFPELCQAADYVTKNIKQNLQEEMFGNPLPKTIEELGRCDSIRAGESLISEINWVLIAIRKYAKKIPIFLKYKDEFEKNYLTGKYKDAEKVLDKIDREICVSLWGLENRFLISELSDSSVGSKDLLSKFNKSNKSVGVTKSLAHYLCNRAERSLSVGRFNADLENALGRMAGEKRPEHRSFYLFKLSFLNNSEFSNYTEILSFDFPHSIIDRYLHLRKVFASLITSANKMNDKVEDGRQIKQYVVNRINYITRKISDPLLFKLKLFASEKLFPAFDLNETKIQIAVIDKYTTGRYGEAEATLRELLLNDPTQFDLYELYVKTLLYQKKDFSIVGNAKTLLNEILLQMYSILSIQENPATAGSNLLRIANNISSCDLSYGIVDFAIQKTKDKNERRLLARLSYSAANPVIYEIYNTTTRQLEYLDFLKSKFPDSITIDFLAKKISRPEELSQYEGLIPDFRFKTELSKGQQIHLNFEGAAVNWEGIIKDYSDIASILEIAVRNLFICFEEMKRFDDCIQLYVESFFKNQYLVTNIECENLIRKIKENRFKNVKPTIDLPIFYTIFNADENETHTAYERFNLNSKVLRPTDLLRKYEDFPKNKIVFYLKFTCGQEILKHSIYIIGSKERLEERLAICQFLRDKDLPDKENYDEEIKQVTNILVIQKGLLELDESKIYVNEQGIISNELKDYEPIYQRFRTVAEIAEKTKFTLFIKNGLLKTLDFSEDKAETKSIEFSQNPADDIYKELFEVIKEKFLHSKFGIVAYLSTRIRHGVLLGEIRPIFEKFKLITLRESESTAYRVNAHWENVYRNEAPLIQGRLQAYLRDFSISIDGLIFDLIKKYLQVYDKDLNKDGWFNYDFTDKELFWPSWMANNTRDFSHFASEVMQILWIRTDFNLKIIRRKIQKDISDSFNHQFNALEKDVTELLGHYNSQSIVSSIKACSTETLTVISKISSWFKRSGTTASDFHLENLINIVMEYTNKSNQNKQIHLDRSIEFDCKIKGKYLTHFADLIRIFMDNIIKHSSDKKDVISARIETKKDDNILVINIQNEITDSEKLNPFRATSKKVEVDLSKLLNEGKSGYVKADKILRSDLQNENNIIATCISEDEKTFTVSMFICVGDLLA